MISRWVNEAMKLLLVWSKRGNYRYSIYRLCLVRKIAILSIHLWPFLTDCTFFSDQTLTFRKGLLAVSPGAIMISFFLERTRRKVRSFWGSMSRTVLRAFITSWWIRPAYCAVLGPSRVVLMGIPEGRRRQVTVIWNLNVVFRLKSEQQSASARIHVKMSFINANRSKNK